MNLLENWDLQIDSSVLKFLKRIPKPEVEKILAVIKLLPADPYFGDIQKMKGEEDVWRRRLGSYRIFYKLNLAERLILIFRLERRTSKTYKKR